MEDQNIDPTVSEEVYVDKIDFAVDPNDTNFDESGNPIRAVHPETKKVYVVGKAPEKEKTETGDPIEKKAPDAEKVDANTGNEDAETGDEEGELDWKNPADYILKMVGFERDEVEIGGVKKNISELTPDEQLVVVVDEFDKTVIALNKEIESLQNAEPAELVFDNPTSQAIVDALKKGVDPIKLAKEIISRDPAAQAKIMSDEEVVKMDLKKQFPSWTEEDIADEMKDLQGSKLDRRAKAIRARMEKESPDLAPLTAEQEAANRKAEEAEIAVFKADAAKLGAAISKIDRVLGVPMTDEIRQYLHRELVPAKHDQDTEFIQSLANPEKLARLKFMDQYGEKVVSDLQAYWYAKGKEDANKVISKFQDEPVRTYKASQSKTAETKKPVKIETTKDLDNWWETQGSKTDTF